MENVNYDQEIERQNHPENFEPSDEILFEHVDCPAKKSYKTGDTMQVEMTVVYHMDPNADEKLSKMTF